MGGVCGVRPGAALDGRPTSPRSGRSRGAKQALLPPFDLVVPSPTEKQDGVRYVAPEQAADDRVDARELRRSPIRHLTH